jgi:hypothetical protein
MGSCHDYGPDEWPEESRIDTIGQNGNDAEIYHSNHKHGHATAEGVSPTYSVWRGMKGRCYNPNNAKYYRYGERGIKVCDRWLDAEEGFKNFLADMGEKPDNLSLGRINNDGDYTPSNCRWETGIQQARNTSRTVFIEYEGEVRCLSEWVEVTGIPRTTFYRRYYGKGLRGEELFAPTIHMRKEALFESLEKMFEESGKINFTEAGRVLKQDRKTLASVWEEFTGDEQ